MEPTVTFTEDAQSVLDMAGEFLAGDPVRHNVILTLLHARRADGEGSRNWVAGLDGAPAGVVFQSPATFPATITPMPDAAVVAVVDAITDSGVVLPGVSGEAATAARFAGQWTERHKSAAVPIQGQRIYEVRDVVPPSGVDGAMRVAAAPDRDLLVEWLLGFYADTGERGDAAVTVDRRLPRGHFWVWDDGGPQAMAAATPPVAGVTRLQAVYTPPAGRGRGLASALVATLSRQVLAGGHRCILFTDLGNPTSNSVYRRIGYRAASEVLRYRLDL